MTGKKFIEESANFAPTKKDYLQLAKDFDQEFADYIHQKYTIDLKKETNTTKYELVNLIENYDLSNVEICGIFFKSQPLEKNGFVVWGSYDVDLLAIDINTGEIVLNDHENPDFIMTHCAVNCDSFLDALSYVWRTTTSFLLNREKPVGILLEEIVQNCAKLAGGSKYFNFYESLIGR